MPEENPYLAPSAPIRPAKPVRARSALGIQGTDHMTDDELAQELDAGGKFVKFYYCVSFLIMTVRHTTKDAYFVRAGESASMKGIRWTLLTLVAGWWGFPWGIIYTPVTIIKNLRGGHDVTGLVVMTVLRWDERGAVEQIMEQGPEVANRKPSKDPGDGVPDSLKQIRL